MRQISKIINHFCSEESNIYSGKYGTFQGQQKFLTQALDPDRHWVHILSNGSLLIFSIIVNYRGTGFYCVVTAVNFQGELCF